MAIVGITFSSQILSFTSKLVLEDDIDNISDSKFIETDDFSMPAVSLANAKRQALRMAEISQNMVVSSLAVMRDDNDMLRNEILKNEDDVDNLFDSIKLYIARILQEELTPAESQQALNILNFTTNMEHIGDIVNSSLMDISEKKISQHIHFSKEGFSEIISIHEVVCSNYDLAISTFMSNDCELAKVLYGKKQSFIS